jgi:hypothetical protein
MSNRITDRTAQGHVHGDADGLGCARGIKNCLLMELGAFCAFGFILYFVWQ